MHTIPSSHISANARVATSGTQQRCNDFPHHRYAEAPTCCTIGRIMRSTCMPVYGLWYKWYSVKGAMIFCTSDTVRQFLQHNQRCAANPQFRQHNVSFSSSTSTTLHSSKLWEIFQSTMNETGLTVIAVLVLHHSLAKLEEYKWMRFVFCWMRNTWNLAICCAMYWIPATELFYC